MRISPIVRFVAALVVVGALLTWVATNCVYRTTRDWFEKDVSLRAQLALSGARHGLLAHWRPEHAEDLRALLAELVRDERILAAAACAKDLSELTTTGEFPVQFGCRNVGPHVRRLVGPAESWSAWKRVAPLPGGTVHVSALPVTDGADAVGFVVLVHDLSFVERRETTIRWFVVIAFGLLAIAASGITILAARINERFGRGPYRPVVLRRSHHEPPTVFQYYRAADLCYVSSLHDGMNLVAKEFVAAREDAAGVLVLSQFTGAARELTEALIVNSHDLDESAAALAAALGMPLEEQRARLRSMRASVSELNVYRWAGRMLVGAARLRDRERLCGRLGKSESDVTG